MKNKIFVTAFLVFAMVFLWFASGVLGDLQSWNDWDKPAEISKLIKAGVFGLGAMAMALGIDVGPIIKGALSLVPGTFPDSPKKE